MKTIQSAIVAALLVSTSPLALAQEKPLIETSADLPASTFTLPAAPSEILFENPAAFLAVSQQLDANINKLLSGYEFADATAQRDLLSTQRDIALVEGRWADALALSPQISALYDKPADLTWNGVLMDTFAQAAIEAGDAEGETFKVVFRRKYQNRINAMDYNVVGDRMEQMSGTAAIVTEAIMLGQTQGSLDPAAEAQSNTVDRSFLSTMISTRFTVMLIEVFPIVSEILNRRIAEMAKPKEDLWSSRLVDLNDTNGLSPVVVGVWDSGLDVSLFEGRLWQNENETLNGIDDDGNGHIDDIHGVAYDAENRPTPLALRPMDDVREINDIFDLLKGFLDLQAGLTTDDSQTLLSEMTSLPSEDVVPFQLELGKAVLYMHGTSITDVAVQNNPAAKIVYGRFDYPVTAVPTPESDEDIERQIKRINDTVDYLANAGARVVNMSFVYTLEAAERGLQQTVSDPAERRDMAIARWTRIEAAFDEAFRRHPNVLFVAGAGNDDGNVDFTRAAPAGLNLPNLITVGAVDITLQPTDFTAFGESVDLYANGFEVPARVPGGRVIAASGTSQSSPAVANLAAKLWAIDPELSVADVRNLIESTATEEGEQKLKVIDPSAAIAMLVNQL